MKTHFTDRGIPVLIGEYRAGVKPARLGLAIGGAGAVLEFEHVEGRAADRSVLQSAHERVVVDERSRTLLEKDLPMTDLILDRGVRRLLGSRDARP